MAFLSLIITLNRVLIKNKILKLLLLVFLISLKIIFIKFFKVKVLNLILISKDDS